VSTTKGVANSCGGGSLTGSRPGVAGSGITSGQPGRGRDRRACQLVDDRLRRSFAAPIRPNSPMELRRPAGGPGLRFRVFGMEHPASSPSASPTADFRDSGPQLAGLASRHHAGMGRKKIENWVSLPMWRPWRAKPPFVGGLHRVLADCRRRLTNHGDREMAGSSRGAPEAYLSAPGLTSWERPNPKGSCTVSPAKLTDTDNRHRSCTDEPKTTRPGAKFLDRIV